MKVLVRLRFVLLAISLLGIMFGIHTTVFATDLSGHAVPSQDYKENSWRYDDGNMIICEEGKNDSGIATFALSGMVPEDAKSFGIDVSVYQGVVDWDIVKDQVDFVILRCGIGSDYLDQDDKYWQRNVTECERLGIPYGVYLYSYADTSLKAESEAVHAIRLLEGHTPALPVFYDLEESSISSKCSKAQILEHAQIFCNAIQQAGYTPGVYANTYWWTTFLTDPTYNNWEKWVAQYASSCTYSGDFNFWQYSSTGTIPGISGAVDLNYSRLLIGNGEHLNQDPEVPDDPYAKPFSELKNGSYIKAYIEADEGITIPYTSSDMTTRGSVTHGASSGAYIDNAEDELYLYSVGKNEAGQYWVYCSYPSGNARSFAYIHYEVIADVIYNTSDKMVFAANTCEFYRRHSDVNKNEMYYVLNGEKVYLVGHDTDEARYLVCYPVSGGNWRMVWCNAEDLVKIGFDSSDDPDIPPIEQTGNYPLMEVCRLLIGEQYIKTYCFNKTGITIPYTSSDLTKRGSVTNSASNNAYIDNSADELYVYSAGVNDAGQYWVYCSYPSGNSRSYAYIHFEDVATCIYLGDNYHAVPKARCSLMPRYSSEKSDSYYVSKDDDVYIIGNDTNKGYYLLCYPISGGNWRMAWCTKDDLGMMEIECNHSWNEGEIITAASQCFGTTELRYTCNNCGATYTETIVSEEHIGPELVKFQKKVTCLVDGYTGDIYCRLCGEMISEGELIPATGHQNIELRNQKEASAEQQGYSGDEYCLDCGRCIKVGDIIPRLTYVEIETKNDAIVVKVYCDKPLLDKGIIYGIDSSVTLDTPGRTRITFTELSPYETFTFDTKYLNGYYFRAYVICENGDGEEMTVYSEVLKFQ